MTIEHGKLKGLVVSRETLDRFSRYQALLEKWNHSINLVSRSSLTNLWERHFADSAQLFEIAPKTASRWLDIGTGGGFPGAVIAILAQEKRPTLHVTCVESDQRKAAFLRTAMQELGVNADVIADRAENIAPQNADIVSARALAPITKLLDYAKPHLKEKGVGIFPKGADFSQEIADAQRYWRFKLDRFDSITNPDATILKLGAIRRV